MGEHGGALIADPDGDVDLGGGDRRQHEERCERHCGNEEATQEGESFPRLGR
jgi:hypothetical protein